MLFFDAKSHHETRNNDELDPRHGLGRRPEVQRDH